MIAPKRHRVALRRLNHASRFDNDSKHRSFAGQPVHLPMVGTCLSFELVNVGVLMAELAPARAWRAMVAVGAIFRWQR